MINKHSVWDFLLDILFPRRCVFCSKLLSDHEDFICEKCQTELPWLIGVDSEQKFEFISLCVSPLKFQDNVRDSIHRYKFYDRSLYATTYGHLVSQCITDHLSDRFDVITWVPLSKKSLRKRGYDQAQLLAEAVATELHVESVNVLRKCRNTAQQSGIKKASERRVNVLGAYELISNEKIDGKRVLLIDDVVTTGSTLSECARILRTFGATDVIGATLCRARNEH